MCQALLPKASGGGRVVALEILVPTPAIRNLIREDKIHQIYSSMQAGQEKLGTQTFNQSLASLYLSRQITLEAAMTASSLKDELNDMIQARRRRRAGRRPGSASRHAGHVQAVGGDGAEVKNCRARARARDVFPSPQPSTLTAKEPNSMPTFAYSGRTRGGENVNGERAADTMDAAVAALRREQILVTRITPAKEKAEATGEEGQARQEGLPEEPRGLRAAVLRHDRRRAAAGAVPRDSGHRRKKTRTSPRPSFRPARTSRAARRWPTR